MKNIYVKVVYKKGTEEVIDKRYFQEVIMGCSAVKETVFTYRYL